MPQEAGLGARGVVVGLLFGPAAGGLVEGGGRRWASLLKAASEQDSARGVVVGLWFGPAASGLVEGDQRS